MSWMNGLLRTPQVCRQDEKGSGKSLVFFSRDKNPRLCMGLWMVWLRGRSYTPRTIEALGFVNSRNEIAG